MKKKGSEEERGILMSFLLHPTTWIDRFFAIDSVMCSFDGPFTRTPPDQLAPPIPEVGPRLLLHPNPARTEVFATTWDDGTKHVDLHDLAGRRIAIPTAASGPRIRLDIAGLAHGVYTVRVSDGIQTVTEKLIIH